MIKVSESIWNNGKYIIPMAEISHLEIESSGNNNGIWIIFKHSKINKESNLKMKMEPAIWLDVKDKQSIMEDWCYYRAEVEGMIKRIK